MKSKTITRILAPLLVLAMHLIARIANAFTGWLNDPARVEQRKEVVERAKARMERARADMIISVSTDGEHWEQIEPTAHGYSGIAHIEFHDGWLDPENPICPGCKYCADLSEMSEAEFDYPDDCRTESLPCYSCGRSFDVRLSSNQCAVLVSSPNCETHGFRISTA